jgi:Protein of unknown function (DUF2806)
MADEDHCNPSATDDEGITSQAIAVIDQLAPDGWRSKLARAAAQLLVGTRTGAQLYANTRETLDEIEGRSAMNKQLYAIAAQQVANDPDQVERAKARLIGQTLTKQANIEAVITGANTKMLALPPPAESEVELVPDEVSAISGETSPDEPLSADWAASFSEVAENANSEDLRDRLSRVLAGEIAAAGTFPRSTLRAIAELERTELEALVSLLPQIDGKVIFSDGPIDEETLQSLNDSGLADYNSALRRSMSINLKPDNSVALYGLEWAIIIEVKAEIHVNITVVPLTRLGRAVISLLDQFDEQAAFTGFAERLDKTGVKRITLGKYDRAEGDRIQIKNGAVVFPKPVIFDVGLSRSPWINLGR